MVLLNRCVLAQPAPTQNARASQIVCCSHVRGPSSLVGTARNNSLIWAAANGCDEEPITYTYTAEDFVWEPDAQMLADVAMNTEVVSHC